MIFVVLLFKSGRGTLGVLDLLSTNSKKFSEIGFDNSKYIVR